MDYAYTGPFAENIKALIAEKRAAGHSYTSPAWILKHFDTFTADNYPDAKTLTPEIALAWAKRRDGDSAAYAISRANPVRQLALSMNRMGHEAHVLSMDGFAKPAEPKRHIFTKKELSLFFEAVDSRPSSATSTHRNIVASALFRTIYCCGLRTGEATRLKVEDVDLEAGSITIYQSKGDKNRIVYVSDDLGKLLVCYAKDISLAVPDRAAFFPSLKGGHLTVQVVNQWFNAMWFSLPDPICQTPVKPSIRSFRHTFACERIRLWLKEGKDLRSVIYYLSEYMGHSSFRETEYYLHLLPEHYPGLLEAVGRVSDALLPEVD